MQAEEGLLKISLPGLGYQVIRAQLS
jgi:hypothetical protein